MKKVAIASILINLLATFALTQTTSFTYQGKLTDAGNPPTAQYDLIFRLFDASGTQIGTDQIKDDVQVTIGIFTVTLDFGEPPFSGSTADSLEIAVRPGASTGVYTTLTPRQPLTSSPYAIKSKNAASANTATNSTQLGGVAANQYVITNDPRMTDARTPLAGSADYIQNRSTQQALSNFNVSGTGTANVFSANSQFEINNFRALTMDLNTSSVYGGYTGSTLPTGDLNTFFGILAGTVNTGTRNSFFGNRAGNANTAGSFNSYFGVGAGENNATSNENSFFGFLAGRSTTGGSNTFVGANAGLGNIGGNNNTLVGANANILSQGLSFATAIGAGATINRSNQIVLGRSAGQDEVVIPGPTQVSNSLNASSVVTNLLGIGTGAPTQPLHVVGNGLITGDLTVNGILNANLPSGSGNYVQNNTTTTAQTAGFNISGNGTAAGTLSGNTVNATTQFNLGNRRILFADNLDNLFAGVGAGGVNTGANNSFFGRSSGLSNTTGFGNSFFGEGSGLSNATGDFNSFLGGSAGRLNRDGDGNTFLGSSAGSQNRDQSFNTFVGAGAGQYSGLNDANNNAVANTFIGYGAGLANTTGDNNTLLGVSADLGAGNLVNATAIGASALVSQSNSLVLGNGVNVGIGTTAPTQRLHVVGSGTFSGNLGIGTNPTVFRLAVVDTSANGLRVVANTGGGTIASFGGLGAFKIDAPGIDGGRFTVLENGRVGINAANPTDTLEVNGVIRVNALSGGGGTALCRNPVNQISTCSSSIRYKQNINPFSSGLNLINRLRPVTFNWKTNNMADMGLVAEEVAEVEPLLATYNDKGEVEGVKYDRVGVVLINAVKEQQAQIERQQKLIEMQQQQIDALKKLVCEKKQNAELCSKKEN